MGVGRFLKSVNWSFINKFKKVFLKLQNLYGNAITENVWPAHSNNCKFLGYIWFNPKNQNDCFNIRNIGILFTKYLNKRSNIRATVYKLSNYLIMLTLGTVHLLWGRGGWWEFGKHHLKIAWPPLNLQIFLHAPALIAVIFLNDPLPPPPPPPPKKINRPSRFYLFNILYFSLFDVIEIKQKRSQTLDLGPL